MSITTEEVQKIADFLTAEVIIDEDNEGIIDTMVREDV